VGANVGDWTCAILEQTNDLADLEVLASDYQCQVGCIGSMILHNQTGTRLCPCSSVQRLAECIEQLWRDGNLYKRMVAESSHISESQDVVAAAQQLAFAARKLHELGPRRTNRAAPL
jgi:hypothetical protein